MTALLVAPVLFMQFTPNGLSGAGDPLVASRQRGPAIIRLLDSLQLRVHDVEGDEHTEGVSISPPQARLNMLRVCLCHPTPIGRGFQARRCQPIGRLDAMNNNRLVVPNVL